MYVDAYRPPMQTTEICTCMQHMCRYVHTLHTGRPSIPQACTRLPSCSIHARYILQLSRYGMCQLRMRACLHMQPMYGMLCHVMLCYACLSVCLSASMCMHRMDGWMDGWMDAGMYACNVYLCICVFDGMCAYICSCMRVCVCVCVLSCAFDVM